jgi:hypothetical protein
MSKPYSVPPCDLTEKPRYTPGPPPADAEGWYMLRWDKLSDIDEVQVLCDNLTNGVGIKYTRRNLEQCSHHMKIEMPEEPECHETQPKS